VSIVCFKVCDAEYGDEFAIVWLHLEGFEEGVVILPPSVVVGK